MAAGLAVPDWPSITIRACLKFSIGTDCRPYPPAHTVVMPGEIRVEIHLLDLTPVELRMISDNLIHIRHVDMQCHMFVHSEPSGEKTS